MSSGTLAFDGLTRITSALLASEQARLAGLKGQEDSLRAQLVAIDSALRLRAGMLATSPDAAVFAGVDMRWHLWIEERRSTLTHELARVLAKREEFRARLATAVGRNAVAEQLATDYRQDQIKKRLERAARAAQ